MIVGGAYSLGPWEARQAIALVFLSVTITRLPQICVRNYLKPNLMSWVLSVTAPPTAVGGKSDWVHLKEMPLARRKTAGCLLAFLALCLGASAQSARISPPLVGLKESLPSCGMRIRSRLSLGEKERVT